jgi:hypothetical protein
MVVMTHAMTQSDLVLVAVMPARRDLEIARLLGWYRIPLRFAPKVIAVDFIAFFQTGAFGEEHRWRVEAFAPVRGHELTTRGELFRDEPNHPRAGEEYYKISIGSLQTRASPILADNWKRLTFLYTTGELFEQAQTLTDLVVRSEERELLWRSLRERAQCAGSYQTEDWPELELDAELLAFLGGNFVAEPKSGFLPDE